MKPLMLLLVLLLGGTLTGANPPVEIQIASFKSVPGIKKAQAALELSAEELSTLLAAYTDGGVLLDPVVKSGVYKKKTFYYLAATVVRPNAEPNEIAFMLQRSGSNLVFAPESGCVVECRRTDKSDCAFCRLEIKKPCEKVKCPCEGGGTGFEAVVVPSSGK